MKTKTKILGLVIFDLLFVVSIVYAQSGGLIACGGNGKKACEIRDLVRVVIRLINYLFALAGFVAMFFIVWSGWNMVGSGGNEEKITAAKATLSDAIIGFFLILVSFLLIDAIIGLLGNFSLKDLVNNFIIK